MIRIIEIFLHVQKRLSLFQSIVILIISLIAILALLIKALTFFLPFTYVAF